MPTLIIPDETFDRVAKRAASLGLTIEQLVLPILEQAATAPDMTPTDRKRAFAELTTLVRSHASLYPPGHVLDDTRESIYDERLRGQR